jgi:hypothetical protein
MKKYCLLLFLTIAFWGCKKHPTDDTTNQPEVPVVIGGTGLPGTWELTYGVQGFSGMKTNYPLGNGRKYIFTNTNYQVYKSGILIAQGTYVLEQQMSYIYNKLSDMIIFDNNSSSKVLITISSTTLDLAPDANDGGGTGYLRIK